MTQDRSRDEMTSEDRQRRRSSTPVEPSALWEMLSVRRLPAPVGFFFKQNANCRDLKLFTDSEEIYAELLGTCVKNVSFHQPVAWGGAPPSRSDFVMNL